jgi:uncharacterized membrane protein
LIWSNVRALFFVQTLGLAVAGLFLYKIVRVRNAALAPWFLLAFYLNPALHEVALVEFRRVTLAVPFLAMALYALYVCKRRLMLVGLVFALLCKEDLSLIVLMVGIHHLLFERDWKWGVPVVLLGAAWAIVVTLVVIPIFAPPGKATLYPQYFDLSGDTPQAVIVSAFRNLPALLGRMLDRKALLALWRVLLPVALVLPFLAADYLLIVLPTVAYMLMASAPATHRLENWYMASVLPGLFAAVAVGLGRVSKRWARALTIGLLCATVAGYALYSHAPLGGRHDPNTYTLTQHHRLAAQAVAAIPADARVAAQDPYVPHLSHRERISLYALYPMDSQDIDYLLLDRHLSPYPLQPYQMDARIDDLIADPSYVVEMEADGIFVLRTGGEPLPSFAVDVVADRSMLLERVEVAARDQDGVFRPASEEPVELERGQQVRVSLYWEALAAPDAERTVSVRIVDASGAVVAIQDNLPGQGKKPTSWWKKGWRIRDVYYLTVSPQAQTGAGSLDVLLYDSTTQETVRFEETEVLNLSEILIVSHARMN